MFEEKYNKYKTKYLHLKEIEKILANQHGGNKDIFNINSIESTESEDNNNSQTILENKKVKQIIKQPGYKNRFIYRNNINKNFINELELEKVLNKKSNTFSYYKINKTDDILNKFKNNKKYFNDNSQIRILNYDNNELMFEVYN